MKFNLAPLGLLAATLFTAPMMASADAPTGDAVLTAPFGVANQAASPVLVVDHGMRKHHRHHRRRRHRLDDMDAGEDIT